MAIRSGAQTIKYMIHNDGREADSRPDNQQFSEFFRKRKFIIIVTKDLDGGTS